MSKPDKNIFFNILIFSSKTFEGEKRKSQKQIKTYTFLKSFIDTTS